MSDEQDVAEALDPDEIGEEPEEDFPPDRPMGSRSDLFAEDGSIADDDVAERADREVPDVGAADDQPIDLQSQSELDEIDDEEALVADPSEDEYDSDSAPAEIAAIHVISEREATEPFDEGA